MAFRQSFNQSFSGAGMLLALVLLAGCQESSAPAPTKTTARAHNDAADPIRQQLQRSSTAGVRTGMGDAAVEVRFALSSAPMPGRPFGLTVSVLPNEASMNLSVEVPPAEDLKLAHVAAPVSYDKVEKGSIFTIPMEFVAATAGVHIVSVTVHSKIPTGSDSVTYAYPVLVGSAPVAPATGAESR